MKKRPVIYVLALLFVGCNNNGSVKEKMDSLGKKFDSSAEKIWDSTKEKGKELGNKIRNKIENKDSAH